MAASMWCCCCSIWQKASSAVVNRVLWRELVNKGNPVIKLGLLPSRSLSFHTWLYAAPQLHCAQSLHQYLLPTRWDQSPARCYSSLITSQESSQDPHSQVEAFDLDRLYETVELKVKGHDNAVLESYEIFVTMAAKELGTPVHSVTKPLRKVQRMTLLKSRHIFKKHRVQYEIRTYFRVIQMKHVTGSTADVFLEYIQRNLPEGVAMKVTKTSIETIPAHLQSAPLQGEDTSSSSSSSSTTSNASSSDDEDDATTR